MATESQQKIARMIDQTLADLNKQIGEASKAGLIVKVELDPELDFRRPTGDSVYIHPTQIRVELFDKIGVR